MHILHYRGVYQESEFNKRTQQRNQMATQYNKIKRSSQCWGNEGCTQYYNCNLIICIIHYKQREIINYKQKKNIAENCISDRERRFAIIMMTDDKKDRRQRRTKLFKKRHNIC